MFKDELLMERNQGVEVVERFNGGRAYDLCAAHERACHVDPVAKERARQEREEAKQEAKQELARAAELERVKAFARAQQEPGTASSGAACTSIQELHILERPELLQMACSSALEAFDANRDGVLELSEIQALVEQVCARAGVGEISPEKVEKLFSIKDTNKDNLLQKEEFEGFYTFLLQNCAKEQKKLNPW